MFASHGKVFFTVSCFHALLSHITPQPCSKSASLSHFVTVICRKRNGTALPAQVGFLNILAWIILCFRGDMGISYTVQDAQHHPSLSHFDASSAPPSFVLDFTWDPKGPCCQVWPSAWVILGGNHCTEVGRPQDHWTHARDETYGTFPSSLSLFHVSTLEQQLLNRKPQP